MVRMSVQAFDQQGEPWGRDQFPARSKVSPFCRAVQTSTGTRKLESYTLERPCACLVLQKLQGLFASCQSSRPPHLPVSPVSGPLRSGVQRGPFPTSGASCCCQPSVGWREAELRRGTAAPGARGSTLQLLKALATGAVMLDVSWPPGLHKLGPSRVSGPQQENWEGPPIPAGQGAWFLPALGGAPLRVWAFGGFLETPKPTYN